MAPVEPGVYVITNKASKTYLDLTGGSKDDRTPLQGWTKAQPKSFSNQYWVMIFARTENRRTYFNVRNLTSGTYMDLVNGSSDDGTIVQGYKAASSQNIGNQMWYFEPFDDEFFYIWNYNSGTVIDLDKGKAAKGTKVQCWTKKAGAGPQLWHLERVSRTGSEVARLIQAETKTADVQVNHFSGVDNYISLPIEIITDIWKSSGVGNKTRRPLVFDYNDFAFVTKASVSLWCQNHFGADLVAVLFGVVFGEYESTWCGMDSYAWNWYLDGNMALEFLDPKYGTRSSSITHTGYFAIA